MFRKIIVVAAVATLFTGHAQASGFQVGGGFGSSADISGGSQATAGSNGNGYSYQTSGSNGTTYSVGGTALGAGVSYGGNVGAIGGLSGSYATGGSVTNATAYGTTGYDGYGATKSGAGGDYSSYGNNGVSASYAY